jgi:hypothetical protein
VLLVAVAAAALMPWIAFLTTSLPMTHEARHWRIARRWRSQTRPRLLLRAPGARDQLDGSLASTAAGLIAAPAPADADACA